MKKLTFIFAVTTILGMNSVVGQALQGSTAPLDESKSAATPAPKEAQLYFIAPRPGARVASPVTIQFGLRGMGVTQAGSVAKNAGHHHLLIDSKEDVKSGEPLPADKNHLHFGGGQTETRVDLSPGRHTLQLVLGDALHKPFSPSVQSQKIDITVLTPQSLQKRKRLRRRRL